MSLPAFMMDTPLHPSFDQDIRDTHLLYDYDARDANGNPEKWRETGTICSLVYDIPNKKISTLLGFSKGHWEHPKEAHGDKRNPEDFERWRGLAKLGSQVDRMMLSEQANILEAFKGKGDLVPIQPDAETL